MKSPNFNKWVKKQRKAAGKLSKAGDNRGAIDILTPVMKELGKRFDKKALANYQLTNSISDATGRRPSHMDRGTEADMRLAIRAILLWERHMRQLVI